MSLQAGGRRAPSRSGSRSKASSSSPASNSQLQLQLQIFDRRSLALRGNASLSLPSVSSASAEKTLRVKVLPLALRQTSDTRRLPTQRPGGDGRERDSPHRHHQHHLQHQPPALARLLLVATWQGEDGLEAHYCFVALRKRKTPSPSDTSTERSGGLSLETSQLRAFADLGLLPSELTSLDVCLLAEKGVAVRGRSRGSVLAETLQNQILVGAEVCALRRGLEGTRQRVALRERKGRPWP